MGGGRKAVKTELLLKNEIRFSEHKVGEEAIYSFLLMHYAKSFSFITGSVYEYVNRKGSQSNTKYDDPWGNVVNTLKEKIKQMGLYEKYADTINAFCATATIVSLDKVAGNYSYVDYRERAKERVEQYKRELDNEYPIDTDHMPIKAKILLPFLKMEWLTLIYVISSINRARR